MESVRSSIGNTRIPAGSESTEEQKPKDASDRFANDQTPEHRAFIAKIKDLPPLEQVQAIISIRA